MKSCQRTVCWDGRSRKEQELQINFTPADLDPKDPVSFGPHRYFELGQGKYPLVVEQRATDIVLEQAEVLCKDWAV